MKTSFSRFDFLAFLLKQLVWLFPFLFFWTIEGVFGNHVEYSYFMESSKIMWRFDRLCFGTSTSRSGFPVILLFMHRKLIAMDPTALLII